VLLCRIANEILVLKMYRKPILQQFKMATFSMKIIQNMRAGEPIKTLQSHNSRDSRVTFIPLNGYGRFLAKNWLENSITGNRG
jgi:hypothetical protein